jgi:anti-sigma factor RsiW
MNSDCEKMRDRIADLITGTLAETEAQAVAQHIGKCAACREYGQALEEEDRLLGSFIAGFGAEMGRRELEAIGAVRQLDTGARSGRVNPLRMQLKRVLVKHAAAAVVVVVVGLYFVITFSWVTQITALIRYGL